MEPPVIYCVFLAHNSPTKLWMGRLKLLLDSSQYLTATVSYGDIMVDMLVMVDRMGMVDMVDRVNMAKVNVAYQLGD